MSGRGPRDPGYLARMRDHFAGSAGRFDPADPRFVGWGSAASQEARFSALASGGLERSGSVLDVGCGTGALAGWLRARGWKGAYLGLDLVPSMVEAARRLRPGERFLAGTLRSRGIARFDWVVASGIFFLPSPRWEALVEEELRRMFRRCRVGVAANFLSGRSPRPDSVSRYADPREVLAIAFRVSPLVSLRHDYLPNDFTVLLRREPPAPRRSAGSRRTRRPGHRS